MPEVTRGVCIYKDRFGRVKESRNGWGLRPKQNDDEGRRQLHFLSEEFSPIRRWSRDSMNYWMFPSHSLAHFPPWIGMDLPGATRLFRGRGVRIDGRHPQRGIPKHRSFPRNAEGELKEKDLAEQRSGVRGQRSTFLREKNKSKIRKCF